MKTYKDSDVKTYTIPSMWFTTYKPSDVENVQSHKDNETTKAVTKKTYKGTRCDLQSTHAAR